MAAYKRNIIFILLLIMTLCFNACYKETVPDALLNFKNSYENSDDYLENLSKIADSCSEKYAKNTIFLEKKSQIYFQKGRNQHKKNDYLSATKSFVESYNSQKTLISLKNNPENDDYHFLGQILENIGDIYYDVNSLKPASYFYDKALQEYERSGSQPKMTDILVKIGDLYFYNHIPNIALLNYETAESKNILTEEQHNSILIKKGIALYDIADTQAADSIYETISKITPQNIDYQYFIGYHFYNMNNYDEALPHLLQCFEDGSQRIKIMSAEILASVYFSLNNHEKELFYAQYQAKTQSAEARLTPVKMELDSIYDDFIVSSDKQKDNRGKGLTITWLFTILFVALIIVAIAFILFKRKYDESHQTIQDKDNIINDISKQLEETKKRESTSRSFTDDYNNFVHTKIYTQVKSSLDGHEFFIKTVNDYPRLALTRTQLAMLTTKFNESLPNLTHTLSDLYPSLTPADMRYIILSLMGFSVLEIAVLLRQQYGSVNKRDNRIQNIFNTKEELRLFLPHFLSKIKY